MLIKTVEKVYPSYVAKANQCYPLRDQVWAVHPTIHRQRFAVPRITTQKSKGEKS